jgi:hypothetical protein
MDEVIQADRDGTRPFDNVANIPEEVVNITRKLMALDVPRKR